MHHARAVAEVVAMDTRVRLRAAIRILDLVLAHVGMLAIDL